ncbi:DUF6232 family protein [Catellatospora sp. NPDC049609]|uniref:DUF6232 family protein n=1 Tax=Catellatospora sp. NPDC049609 TaxID=3155505 RepID=UPI003435D648
MTIGPGLHFSSTCFQVGGRHFTLTALDSVHIRQAGHDPLTRRAGAMAAGGVVLLGVFAPLLRPAGIVAAVAVLSGLAVLTLISSRRRPRRLELWADYHGHPTQLFVSDDWWLFHGVERHLRRVLADARLGHFNLPQRPTRGVPHPSVMHPSRLTPGGRRSGWERAA